MWSRNPWLGRQAMGKWLTQMVRGGGKKKKLKGRKRKESMRRKKREKKEWENHENE